MVALGEIDWRWKFSRNRSVGGCGCGIVQFRLLGGWMDIIISTALYDAVL